MFQWDKSIKAINIPASQVIHLFRSMRDVQLALPGISAQSASAFLCQYQRENGAATIAVFHLHKSRLLAFYCSTPRIVPAQKIDSMLDQGLNFVESMGFLMTDQDLHLLDQPDQEMLWASLPLAAGLEGEAAPSGAVVSAEKTFARAAAGSVETSPEPAPAKKRVAAGGADSGSAAGAQAVKAAPGQVANGAEPAREAADQVDDLLAAVAALRNQRPGLRPRKSPPPAQEMARRRKQLAQAVGRILASL